MSNNKSTLNSQPPPRVLGEEHVIEYWWRLLDAPGRVCLVAGDPPEECLFCDQERVSVANWIRFHEGEHLFFSPHMYTWQPGLGLRRKKECSVLVRGLWSDLDAIDPSGLGDLEPTIAIETSPNVTPACG